MEKVSFRIKNVKKRPLLSGPNPLNNILSIWEKRKKYYYESSHHIINSNELSINNVINIILTKVK